MKKALSLFLLVVFIVFASNAATLKKVSYKKVVGGVDVSMTFSGKIRYEIFKLDNPYRVVINLPSTKSYTKYKKIPINVSGMQEVRVAQFKKSLARVVIQMKKWYPYFPEKQGNTIILHFTIDGVTPETTSGNNVAKSKTSEKKYISLTPELHNIELDHIGEKIRLIVSFNSLPNYAIKEKKHMIEIQLYGIKDLLNKKHIVGDGEVIKGIDIAPLDKKDFVLKLNMKNEFPYNVEKNGKQLILTFDKSVLEMRYEITSIESEMKGEKIFLRYKTSGWVRFEDQQLPKQEKIRLVFKNATISQSLYTIPVRKGPVVEINNSFMGNDVYSDIKLTNNIEYRLFRDDKDIVMEITPIENEFAANKSINRKTGKISEISVQDEKITLLLTTIAKASGYNIVFSKSVKGKTTVDLHDVTWEDALDTILRNNGYVYKIKGNIIMVGTVSEFKQEVEAAKRSKELADVGPMESRIIPLSYAAAGDILKIVKNTLSKKANAVIDKRTNALILTDVPARLDNAMKIIKYLDKPTPQVMIEAKFIKVSTSAMETLGIKWQLSNNGTFYSSDATFSGTVTSGGGTDINVSGNGSSGQIVTSLLDTFDLNMKLSMLVSEDKAQILATPKITALNNETATFMDGKQIPIQQQDESGNTVSTLTSIGIKLSVTPTINASNEVLLKITPEVSDLLPPANGAQLIISKQSASTKLLVKDGKTAVIGGLVRKDHSLSTSGVPILKDIPILGALFRNKVKRNSSEEILIFVTPHIIRPNEF